MASRRGWMIEKRWSDGSLAGQVVNVRTMEWVPCNQGTLFPSREGAKAVVAEWAETFAEFDIEITEHVFT